MADENEINSGIYAILADDHIVYVGQTGDLIFRMRSHLCSIAKGEGLAARFPSTFDGKLVSAKAIERIDHGDRPVNPKWNYMRDNPDYAAHSALYRDWIRHARDLRVSRELFYIEQHQPICNKHGRKKLVRLQTVSDIEAMRVRAPGKGQQASTALSITA